MKDIGIETSVTIMVIGVFIIMGTVLFLAKSEKEKAMDFIQECIKTHALTECKDLMQ